MNSSNQKFVIVTQRELILPNKEVRDSLDQSWFEFFNKTKLLPLILPNNLTLAKKMISQIEVAGFVLTGGDDIKSISGSHSKREKLEDFLIKLALKKNLPLLGVCRGMQKIQDHFKIPLKKISGHVKPKQTILINGKRCVVNSFHDFATKENNDKEFEVFAIADDGVVKAIKHKKYKVFGIMWHPERMNPMRVEDIKFFVKIFK
jgi:gamma-glutamyl-gamma-aminobutyrate hydrolase PuuD